MILRETAGRALRGAAEGAGLVLGLSGGVDSVALAHLLVTHYRRLGISAVHVHHGIRGGEAERDAAFCAGLCADWGLPFELARVDAPALARERKLTLEQAARQLRYEALDDAAARRGASLIATAHHADDMAETVLMNLFRGAGTAGLGGMAARRGGVIRPLLKATRAEILAYANERGLSYIEDSTNNDNGYTRNYIRNVILPAAAARFGESVRRTIATAAELTRADDDYLSEAARAAFDGMGGELDVARLKDMHVALRRRVLRLAIEQAKGDLVNISAAQMEDALALLDKQSGRTAHLSGGVRVTRRLGRLAVDVITNGEDD